MQNDALMHREGLKGTTIVFFNLFYYVESLLLGMK